MTYCSILPPLPVPDLPLDPPDEPAPVGCCAYCGGDIYPGDAETSTPATLYGPTTGKKSMPNVRTAT